MTKNKNKLLIGEDFRQKDPVKLYAAIKANSSLRFNEPPKALQIEAVVALAQEKHCFTLAGTGFGKSRIAEMYSNLYDETENPIVLVLNPLDSLWDNQSPKVFLNNHIFHRRFLNEQFLSRVVLAVVDEAHMIYMWGLVASGQAKGLNSHGKIQDLSIFRPGYGNMGAKLMAIGAPILLMSATCRPQAIDSILVSLKI
ncbi:hypothetical protein PTTG_10349, partial [Puccinia triticina 1-1 BBBD Race 1]